MWTVYILECKDGSLYTGVTNDLERRFKAHQEGRGGKYTRSHRPKGVVHTERYRSKNKALSREAKIKLLSKSEKLSII